MAIVNASCHVNDSPEPVQMVTRTSRRGNAHVPCWTPPLYQVENTKDSSQTKLSNKSLTVVTIAMLSVAGALTVLAVASLAPGPRPTTNPKNFFPIALTLNRFNESKNHPHQPWANMREKRCSTV